jgi:hypothetical protein
MTHFWGVLGTDAPHAQSRIPRGVVQAIQGVTFRTVAEHFLQRQGTQRRPEKLTTLPSFAGTLMGAVTRHPAVGFFHGDGVRAGRGERKPLNGFRHHPGFWARWGGGG